MARYIDAEALTDHMLERYAELCEEYGDYDHYTTGYGDATDVIENAPTADVVPKSEVEKIFEKLKVRECSNSVCAWCVHATAYGRRNEECDKPYIDKNGKEQKACYVYSKFESLIDKELAELKKKYTGETEPQGGEKV